MIKVNTLENYEMIQDKYYVTTCGKIVTKLKSGEYRILKANINKKGYHQYRLYTTDGNSLRPYVHKLVAIAYIPNDIKENDQVDHVDMNKANNSINNLEWVTNYENTLRRNINGKNGMSKLTRANVIYIRQAYKLWREGKIWISNAKDLAVQFNVSTKTITNIANGLSYKFYK